MAASSAAAAKVNDETVRSTEEPQPTFYRRTAANTVLVR